MIMGIRKNIDEQSLHIPPDLPELDTDEAASNLATLFPMPVLDVEKIVS